MGLRTSLSSRMLLSELPSALLILSYDACLIGNVRTQVSNLAL